MENLNLKYPRPSDLQAVVDKYFEDTPQDQWTVTGLALMVGTKQLLKDYEDREGYRDIILTARLKVENAYEISLRDKGGAANIFALKNFGWKDKSETETYGKDGGPIKTENVIEFVRADAGKTS